MPTGVAIDLCEAAEKLSDAELSKRIGECEQAECGMAWIVRMVLLPILYQEVKNREEKRSAPDA